MICEFDRGSLRGIWSFCFWRMERWVLGVYGFGINCLGYLLILMKILFLNWISVFCVVVFV